MVVIDGSPARNCIGKRSSKPAALDFNFRGPDEKGWSRAASASISTFFIMNCSADPKKIDEATRQHYAAL